jgi:predicted nuclease of predicted toxin-antitoxin system
MKLLADENLPLAIIQRLREEGHEVSAIRDLQPGLKDDHVLAEAGDHQLIVTQDKDFGALVFQRQLDTQGVLLVRLPGTALAKRAELIARTIEQYGDRLLQAFTVISPNGVRHQRIDQADAES